MSGRFTRFLPLLAVLGWAVPAPGQERQVHRGAQAGPRVRAHSVDVDLRDLPLVRDWEPGDPIKEIPRRAYPRPGQTDERSLAAEPHEDPLLDAQGAVGPTNDVFTTPLVNIAGQGFSGVNPPDTVGDVGPSHYIQMINHSSGATFRIFDKNGNPIAGPSVLDALAPGGNCATGLGDPVVLYDPLAARWLMSEFSNAGNRLCVYVSKTSDPVSGGWWFYEITAPDFPDYPKYAVWPDAYYVSSNEGTGSPVYALDRANMLNGATARGAQRFAAPDMAGFSFQALTPADLDGPTAPPSGAAAIFARHRDDEAHNPPGTANDFIELWEFHVDWTSPASSTFTGPTNIAVAQFDSALCGLTSFNCIPQPGSSTTLDPLREVVMFRLQYRNFGTHQALVGNFATDVNGADRAGIRWFELRKTSGAWALQQQGTYSPDATHRWMGSTAMDGAGNIAVGYSVSASSSVFPGIRYAGRLAGDPAGTLPQGESTLVSGSAANASNRWGDYAALGVDPADDCTFWFTTMYSPSSQWATRIGAFKFDTCGGGPPTPDFTIAAAPSSVSIVQGTSGTSTITVGSLNAFASAVTLSATGLPAGVTASFSPNPVTPPAGGSTSTTLTLSASASASTGTFPLTITGTSGALSHSAGISLTVTPAGGGGGPQTAVFDATLQAPRCSTVGTSCDSAALVNGRDGKGAEPNQPNTIADSCADGTSGTYHSDESNDRLKVSTLDGTDLAAGKTVRIDATVWAWTTPSADKLDLYFAANANSSTWTFIATLTPTAAGAQTIGATYTLPSGALQAVRARFRYQGAAAPCGTGAYDDHDDLVFAVGGDTTPPTTSITAPAAGSTVSGTVNVTATASDNVGVTRVEFLLDGVVQLNDTTAPYSWSWNTTTAANGAHTLQTRAFDAAGNSGSSPGVGVTVSNQAVITATFDTALQALRCSSVGSGCDSGASLLLGRDGRGPEPNQPNTINDSCPDGTSGTFHSDESNDRLKVETLDGTALAGGKQVRITATVWAWTTPSSDKLDLYFAASGASPTWTLITTLTPTAAGTQILTALYTLPTGSALQAIRAQFRYTSTNAACSAGGYNDRDDLVFAVQ